MFSLNLRVIVENERTVGEGPVREFFIILMGFIQNGLYLDDPRLLTMLFKGESDLKLFLFNCNFDEQDFSIHSQFYTELLQW